MHHGSILIITYGRTGSTLLMGLLNTIPGVLIRGENMGLARGLHSATTALLKTKITQGTKPTNPTHPFFGAEFLDFERFTKDLRATLKNQIVPPHRHDVKCWGFKEIRYLFDEPDKSQPTDLEDHLTFLKNLLPNPAMIFLTRRHEDVVTSGFWARNDKYSTLKKISNFEESAKRWSSANEGSFWIDYSDIFLYSERLQLLYEFLGAPLNWSQIEATLSIEHSYGAKGKNRN